MTTRRTALIALLAGAILAGGVAKTVRYANKFQPLPGGAQHAVAQAFSSAGWHWNMELKPQPDDPYPWMVFAKPGCPHDLTVSILGPTLELQKLVDLYYDGQVTYVQNGHLTDQPSRAAGYWTTLKNWLRPKRDAAPTLPLLAISPIPRHGEAGCTIPFVHRV